MIPRRFNIAGLLPVLLLLTQCERVEALFKPKPKEPGPYAFDLVLRMSPRAEAALKRPGAGIEAYASYYGDAAPAYHGPADKMNRIYLGEELWTYPGAVRRVHFHGEPIDTSKLSGTRDGVVKTVVSISMTLGNPDDMMSCHAFVGPIRFAQQHLQVLNCEFDSETYWDDQAAASSQ